MEAEDSVPTNDREHNRSICDRCFNHTVTALEILYDIAEREAPYNDDVADAMKNVAGYITAVAMEFDRLTREERTADEFNAAVADLEESDTDAFAVNDDNA